MSAPACYGTVHFGPFVGAGEFDAHPDPVWHGQRTCERCRSTVRVEERSCSCGGTWGEVPGDVALVACPFCNSALPLAVCRDCSDGLVSTNEIATGQCDVCWTFATTERWRTGAADGAA